MKGVLVADRVLAAVADAQSDWTPRPMKKPTRILAIGTLVCILPPTLLGGGSTEVGLTSYYFSDSGDNRVVTMALNLAKQILSRTFLSADFELDQVTVPAVTAVTGATRPQRRKNEPFEKSRKQFIVGLKQGIGDYTTLGGNYYNSTEVDYRSNSVIGTFSQEVNNRNTTFTVRGQYTSDWVGKILEHGDIHYQAKKTYAASVALVQVLSSTAVMDLMYDVVIHKGFQSDPYRQVKVYEGTSLYTLTDELHPDKRLRQAAALKLSHYISPIRASLIGSYRYYWDDWQVASHTAEAKFNTYLLDDLVFGVNYRYYTQGAAYFYKARYTGPEFLAGSFRTSDYKLKKFSSNNFGLGLTYFLRSVAKESPTLAFLQDSSIEVLYFRYFNDLDFSANILQATVKFSL